MKSINIQGVEIPMKEKGCLCDGKDSCWNGQYVTINIYLTNKCNGSCKFCCNVDNNNFEFDLDKFYLFINEVVSKVAIKKITFTGGETGLEIEKLEKCLEFIKTKTNAKTVVCTNGTLISEWHTHKDRNMVDRAIKMIDHISVSRHHWDLDTNNAIIGLNYKGCRNNFLDNFPYMDKINISCNLMKGYVDSKDKMYDILEWASNSSIKEVAFVNIMAVNKWSEERKTDIDNLFDEKKVLKYCEWDYFVPNVCHCDNFVYRAKNSELIKFYIRNNLNSRFNKGSHIVWKYNMVQEWY